MRTKPLFLILLALLLFAGTGMPQGAARAQEPFVVVATVDGEITAGTLLYVQRTHRKAVERGASAFMLQLQTPGGLLQPTQDIADLLLQSPIPTAGYVHKQGGFAFSAGTFILLATENAFMHPQSSIGAAQPRPLDGVGEPDPKAVSAMESFMATIAESRNRNSETARLFVRENLTLTAPHAEERGVINGSAATLEAAFSSLGLQEARVERLEMSLWERALSLLALPAVISLLLSISALGAFFAIRSGEFELIPIFLVVFLAGLWGIGSIELSLLGVSLLIVGVFLIALELAEPGFGALGTLGALSLIVSLFTLANEPFFSRELYAPVFFTALGTLLGMLALFFWVSRLVFSATRQKPRTGAEALAGKEGMALTPLAPEGMVLIENYRWKARADRSPIEKGSAVRVIRAEGAVLFVEKPYNTLCDIL